MPKILYTTHTDFLVTTGTCMDITTEIHDFTLVVQESTENRSGAVVLYKRKIRPGIPRPLLIDHFKT